jgi:hypothetical protein
MHTGYYTPMAIPPPRSVSKLQATIRILPPQESVVLTSPAHLILLHFSQYSVAKPVWSSVTHDKIHCELLPSCVYYLLVFLLSAGCVCAAYTSMLRNSLRSRAWGGGSGCSYRVERCQIIKACVLIPFFGIFKTRNQKSGEFGNSSM